MNERLPSAAARGRATKLCHEGASAYVIARDLTQRRFKNRQGGTTWTIGSVRALLKREGIAYEPRRSPRTSPEAIAIVTALCDGTIHETRDALEHTGLKPARGGAWRDVTIRRLRERHCAISTKRRSDTERFRANVVPDAETGCQIWIGALQDGRGKFEVDGQHELAHRWNYEQVHGLGSIPEGHQLHHTCRTPRCVAAGHLVPVTAQEHAALEREEEAINRAALDGTLRNELQTLDSTGWPEWTERAPPRIGARRAA